MLLGLGGHWVRAVGRGEDLVAYWESSLVEHLDEGQVVRLEEGVAWQSVQGLGHGADRGSEGDRAELQDHSAYRPEENQAKLIIRNV